MHRDRTSFNGGAAHLLQGTAAAASISGSTLCHIQRLSAFCQFRLSSIAIVLSLCPRARADKAADLEIIHAADVACLQCLNSLGGVGW